MRVIKSSTDVLEQAHGVVGMFKHIETIGRISHKTEDKITEDSYIKFVHSIKERGHWAVFDLGTVYWDLPLWRVDILLKLLKHSNVWTRYKFGKDLKFHVTTNYRILCQLGLEDLLEKYWKDPTASSHYHRVTGHFVCSRLTSHQLVRHSSLRPMQESQRYVRYPEITYILPQWVYDVRKDVGETIDSLTGLERSYILFEDGEQLWNDLCCIDRSVSSRDDLWRMADSDYCCALRGDDGWKLKPEDARGGLPQDAKTELYLCGFVKDWYCSGVRSEKTGFFKLRRDLSSQRDVRVLADSLYEQFKEKGYDGIL